MLYLDKNGKFQDTHEQAIKEHEEDLELIGDQIIEEVEQTYIDNCNVVEEPWEGGIDLNIADTLDYDKLVKDTIKDYTKDMPKEDIEYITEYVECNIEGEDKLQDIAIERYNDNLDDCPY